MLSTMVIKQCRWLVLATLLQSTVVTAAQPPIPKHLPFADEARLDPGFETFRSRLLLLIQKGNFHEIRRNISPYVTVDDAVFGLKELERAWHTQRSPAAFLRALELVLRLGGRFQDSRSVFVAPYVWTDFPDAEVSPSYVVVVRRPTLLLDAPRVGAKTLAVLSDEVAEYEYTKSRGWLKLDLVDGRSGFVQATNIRQPNDYRAVFKRVDGRWVLTEFAAGVD